MYTKNKDLINLSKYAATQKEEPETTWTAIRLFLFSYSSHRL